MSTQPAVDPNSPSPLKLLSHTGLIYWWPVWLVGFVLAGFTWWADTRLAVVPGGTTVQKTQPAGYALTVPTATDSTLDTAAARTAQGAAAFPVRIARNKNFGMIYVVVTLLVVFGTNVSLRGPATILVVLLLVLGTVLLILLDWWSPILDYLGGLQVEISLAGYLLPSIVLLLLWLGTLLLYDRLRFITFEPGQMVVSTEIGAQQRVYDSKLIQVEKRQNDLFRHWILGFGAGDLVIRVAGEKLAIEVPNVLLVDRRINQIMNLLSVRSVVEQ